MARQRLGQHFLTDAGWREKIARAIGSSRNSTNFSVPDEAKTFCWIEIGAGHGEMTQHLVSTGRPVIAVELDPPLARRLGEMAKKTPNLAVQHQDVLKTDLQTLAASKRM